MKRQVIAYLLAGALFLSLGGAWAFAAEEEEQVPALSDDLYSFQMLLDGELYTFPMSYADFTAMGWEYDGDANETISPNEYTVAETFEKDGLEIYVTLVNLGINTVTYADSLVGGISLDPYQTEDAPDTEAEFPGGVLFGAATAEDIEAAYGTPTDTYEGEMYTKLTYEYDYYREWDFYVYADSGVLDEFEVRNFVADEEANAAAAAEVTDEPTEAVLAYTAPEKLGEDPMGFTVEYAGDLYQLPAPVSVFVENGWTLKEELSDAIVSGGDYGWVTLMKDNQEFRTIAQNYDPNATVIENCFITEVEADALGPDLSLALPGGAAMGMTEEELIAWLDEMGLEYEKDDSDSYIYYSVEGPDSSLDGFEFIVDAEQAAVTGIHVSYEPDTLD